MPSPPTSRSSARATAAAAALCVAALAGAGPIAEGDKTVAPLPGAAVSAVSGAAAAATAPATAAPDPGELLPGGPATRPEARDLLQPSPLLGGPSVSALDFELGAAMFAKLWVAAPSTTRASDGLGPLYNARSCLQCHPGNGGGLPADAVARGPSGMVMRLSAPDGGPDPVLGWQLQDRALPGLMPEGRLAIDWHEHVEILADGTAVTLRRPEARIEPAVPGQRRTSLRVAPAMLGLGLIEAIPEAEIIARADPGDADGDGLSGRVQRAADADGTVRLGRFGWKAAEPTLLDQVASAFALDIGISSPLHPDGAGDCTAAQAACRARPDGNDPGLRDGTEISAAALALTARHVADLAVPGRRDAEAAEALRGRALFREIGCAGCHVPRQQTAGAPLGRQEIWPYSDLLLHDMGEGLADDRPEGEATGREWRTAPLWGLGLAAAAGRPRVYLHDGRARSPLEAVLWHGGEAQGARDRAAGLTATDRAALLRFLDSL
ncbi:di-heme oxidoreductase family protein [Frigidibacter sp. MR17.24]|uniref:di-heme oxidoreductase family protein n=1 Tax=Frigidibacter sp. MR17.24 TaxID=3127345 RepID=UPI0030131878